MTSRVGGVAIAVAAGSATAVGATLAADRDDAVGDVTTPASEQAPTRRTSKRRAATPFIGGLLWRRIDYRYEC
jgi:hypothetical protein